MGKFYLKVFIYYTFLNKKYGDYGIAFEQGQHTADLICNATEIIKSPGIPTKAPIIQQIIALQNAQDKLIADFKNGINHQINEVNVIIKKIIYFKWCVSY